MPRAREVAAGLLAIVVYVMVRAGVGVYPGAGIALDIADAMPAMPAMAPLAQTFQHAPLGPLLARLLGATTPLRYQLLHAAVLVVGVAALGRVVVTRWSPQVALIAATTLAASPAVVVLAAWVGSYDAFTFLCGSAIVVTGRPKVAAVAGFVAAFAAFEQTLVSVGLLLGVAVVLGDRARRRVYLGGLAGTALGALALTAWLRASGVTHGRWYWIAHFGPTHFLHQFARSVPEFLATALGGAVVVVAVALATDVGDARARVAWVGALAVPLVPVALTEDQTRVYAMITWPVVLALVLRSAPAMPPRRVRVLVPVTLLVGLVLPMFVWRGEAP